MERIDTLNRDPIVVVGAGWAGIATVQSLLDQGVPATKICLLERRPRAGGRAFSFTDNDTTFQLDNGQHVLLGCCTSFMDLLSAFHLSNGVRFQPLLDLPVFDDGKWTRISSRKLHGSLHMLPSLLTYGHLGIRERMRLLSVATKLLRPDVKELDKISFGQWLRNLGQNDTAVTKFWDLLGTGILNAHADDVSAGLAAEAFRMGVATGYDAARFGLFAVPLGDLANDAVENLRQRGVDVRFLTAVDTILHDADEVAGVRLKSGEIITTHAVVSTVPHDACLRMLPNDLRTHPSMQQFADFCWSPILNMYITFDTPVMDEALFVSTLLGGMFVFNRGRLLQSDELDGRLLSVSISAADAYRGVDTNQLEERVLGAIESACLRTLSANVVSRKTVWQQQATFVAAPGSWIKRPDAKTPFSGFALAGDWTNTGWPASLEGAVRSGKSAADVVLADWTL